MSGVFLIKVTISVHYILYMTISLPTCDYLASLQYRSTDVTVDSLSSYY